MDWKNGTAVATLMTLFVSPVWAHHSISAVFNLSDTFSVTGMLTEVDFRNPHSEIYLEVRGDDGSVETWRIEGGTSRSFLGNQISKADFERALGQTVTVEALPAKDGSLRGFLLAFTFPDGRTWSRPRP